MGSVAELKFFPRSQCKHNKVESDIFYQ